MQRVNINTPFYWDMRYTMWNYPSAHPIFFDRLRFVYNLCEGSVLDVGCGEGLLVDTLAATGYKATGVDHSRVGLSHAREGRISYVGFIFEKVGEFCEADAHSLPFKDGSFDTVVSTELLEHVDDLPGVISELKRVCRAGGRVIVSVPQEGGMVDPEHIRDISVEELQDFFSDFEEKDWDFCQNVVIFWGRRVE